jgi:CRISPR-associated protein Csm1
VPKLLREQYRNIYTIFAGGDDLFLVGAWDEIMQFSRVIQERFKEYINYNKTKLSISFGISIAKPSTPISYMAGYTEELLEASKELDGKDGISIWDESVKWERYLKTYTELDKIFHNYQDLETATVYRFLELCNMSKNITKDIKNSIWKSKLNYLFSRNMNIDKDKELLMVLDKHISQYPSETKIYLSEFVYKRRKDEFNRLG